MNSSVIFYGAGKYAHANLSRWLSDGLMPVCFADADDCKYYQSITASTGEEFKILPLFEALYLYPDADLIMTVMPRSYSDVFDYLVEQGVAKSRICEPKGNRGNADSSWHCEYIGRYLVLDGLGIKTCCEEQMVNIPSTGLISEDIERYYEYCENLRQRLNMGQITSCIGCHMMKAGTDNEELAINAINLSTGLPGGDKCNFRCCYCTYGQTLGACCARKDNILEILEYVAENMKIKHLTYACGEITVSPFRKEILRLWKRQSWGGTLLTNGSIYMGEIADLLSDGLVFLNVSVDAGTPETFAKIKNVDCYQKVVKNLKRYSEAGKVELKYIVLEGINDNAANIDGFTEIAKSINADVLISRDNRCINTPLTMSEYKAVQKIAQNCIAEGLDYNLLYNLSYMNKDHERLKMDGLIV